MTKPTGPTNPKLKELIGLLKKKWLETKKPLWKDLAERLSKPTRKRAEVNLGKINKYAKDGEIVIVPGAVLSGGEFERKLTIAAWRFSYKAKEKAEKAGSKCMSIEELIKVNPKGAKIRIMV
ncbi:MAG: 50S ribosomal protein L18e [Candidatus Aenigmatarchaeota archaeon]